MNMVVLPNLNLYGKWDGTGEKNWMSRGSGRIFAAEGVGSTWDLKQSQRNATQHNRKQPFNTQLTSCSVYSKAFFGTETDLLRLMTAMEGLIEDSHTSQSLTLSRLFSRILIL